MPKLSLKPAPLMWTMGDRYMPESTERDGLRFRIRHDHYGSRATEVIVTRASDDAHLERVGVTNFMEAENVVRTWDLEEWRAKAEKHWLALSDHRHAMTKLNEIRAFRVEA